MLSADYLKINGAAPQDPTASNTDDPSKVATAVSSLTPEPEAPENPAPLAMTIPGATPSEVLPTEEKSEPAPEVPTQPAEPATDSTLPSEMTEVAENTQNPEEHPDPHDNHYDLHEPEDGELHMKSVTTTQDGIFSETQPKAEESITATTPTEPAPAPEPGGITKSTDAKNQFSSLLKERIEAERAALSAAEDEETRLLKQAAEATKKVKSLREQLKKLSALEDLDPDILELVRSVSAEDK